MNLWRWAQARDRNAVIVGAVCGPLLGIGVALLVDPIGDGSAASTLAQTGSEPVVVAAEPPVAPGPPWDSLDDETPTQVARRVAHTPTPQPKVPPTPAPTASPTPTPSPTPDAGDGEDEQRGECGGAGKPKGKPPAAEGGSEVEQGEPPEGEVGPGSGEAAPTPAPDACGVAKP